MSGPLNYEPQEVEDYRIFDLGYTSQSVWLNACILDRLAMKQDFTVTHLDTERVRVSWRA